MKCTAYFKGIDGLGTCSKECQWYKKGNKCPYLKSKHLNKSRLQGIDMASIFARSKVEAKKKAKSFIKRVGGESPSKFNIKVKGKPNPRFDDGKNKLFFVTIQKKNKR